MDQAESSPSPGRPERREQPAPPPPPGAAAQTGREVPQPAPRAGRPVPSCGLQHPVIAGYDGSASSRNALAYAAGLSSRLGRPLLVVHVYSPGVYCAPLTGPVAAVPRDAQALQRWLLAELAQVTGHTAAGVHVQARRGSPARELAAAAAEFSADALVIGAPARIWHRVAGSVPSRLARHARCPVIVVP
jgi:nucleotide-binding universal stress UspA family protein